MSAAGGGAAVSAVTLTAPSRLHFGLLAPAAGETRRFGGAGAMVAPPSVRLRVAHDTRLSAHGPLAERALDAARRWSGFYGRQPPACRVEVLAVPRLHSGLGVGTQLGLAVAAALNELAGRTRPPVEELAASVGRGARSAVGTYGFCRGGLIAERGKRAGERIGELACQLQLPAAWRFVLLMPKGEQGLSGDEEQTAFDKLERASPDRARRLESELFERLVPAVRAGSFDDFSRSLYRYGHEAGLLFQHRQGGAYNGPRLTALVDLIRSLGIEGVGQSSWGPTLYAALPSAAAADGLVHTLRQHPAVGPAELVVAQPANRGAQLQREP